MATRLLRFAALLAAFCLSLSATASAQPQPTAPGWDLAVTGGSFSGQADGEAGPGYHDDPSTPLRAGWHHAPEWRLTAGRYWTPHLKTEVEFGATGEGDRFIQRLITVPGSPAQYSSSAQDFVRVRQGSARMTWQFLDNQWVHPYLSAGVSFDEERTRTHVYSPIFSPDPRNPSGRVVGTAEHDEAPRTTYRPGIVMGGGAKWYVSPAIFLKTGAQFGFTRSTRSASFTAGIGFDF